MKHNWKYLLMLAAFSAFFLGCTQSGYIVINNTTNGGIVVIVEESTDGDDGVNIDSDDDYTFEIPDMTFSVLEAETREVEVYVIGKYKFAETMDTYVTAGEEASIDIEADGGAVVVSNVSYSAISQVYLVPYTATTWGTNLVSGNPIAVGSTRTWTVSPGYWDIKLVNSTVQGVLAYSLGNYMNVYTDSSRTVTFTQEMISFQGISEVNALSFDAVEPKRSAAGGSSDAKVQLFIGP